MPLVVPLLRIAILFLNVYETYKTLKLPPPSARNGGKPSVRAMTQRKREMKGCMTVWIVWCCFAGYERTFDNIVCIFVPFYNELKSLVLIFFLLTRARGAEPIYLHILRPLIKPYSSTIDWCLESAAVLGDFLLLLCTLPFYAALNWWNNSPTSNPDISLETPHDSELFNGQSVQRPHTRARSGPSIADPVYSQFQLEIDKRARARAALEDIDAAQAKVRQWQAQHRTAGPSGTIRARRRAAENTPNIDAVPGALERGTRRSARRKEGAPAGPSLGDGPQHTSEQGPHHQIWYPPASAYEKQAQVEVQRPGPRMPSTSIPQVVSDASMPRAATPAQVSQGADGVDEWRLYPPFPSAYPPTPLPSTHELPPTLIPSLPIPLSIVEMDVDTTTISPTSTSLANQGDNDRMASSLQAGLQSTGHDRVRPETKIFEQDFGGSLEPSPKLLNPSSLGASSDVDDTMTGVHLPDDNSDNVSPLGETTEEKPWTRSRMLSTATTRTTSTTTSSLPSRSTALTTADDGSSLRTRKASNASTWISDSSSSAGNKRTSSKTTWTGTVTSNTPLRTGLRSYKATASGLSLQHSPSAKRRRKSVQKYKTIRRSTEGKAKVEDNTETTILGDTEATEGSGEEEGSATKKRKVAAHKLLTISETTGPGTSTRSRRKIPVASEMFPQLEGPEIEGDNIATNASADPSTRPKRHTRLVGPSRAPLCSSSSGVNAGDSPDQPRPKTVKPSVAAKSRGVRVRR